MKPVLKKAIFLPIIGVLLIVLLVANIIVAQFAGIIAPFVQSIVSPGAVELSEHQQATLAASDALCQEMGEDSIVLLKNANDALPLAEDVTKINVFGYGATDEGFLLRGVGSGSSTIANSKRVTLLTALRDAGFEYNQDVLNVYNGLSGVRGGSPSGSASYNLNEPDTSAFSGVIDAAKSFSDVALFVISRDGGENIGEIPDAYLDITAKEQATLEYLHANFGTVIVLLNTTNTLHCGFLAGDTVDAAMFVGLLGQSGARGIPNILHGYKMVAETDDEGNEVKDENGETVMKKVAVSPSGKLSDTYTYANTYDPTWVERAPSNSSIQYNEDIYFGYKWYETADVENYFSNVSNSYGSGYDGVVQYPFGYGLSYTSFKWTVTDTSIPTGSTITADTKIEITVKVENVGNVDGKDVVELYYTPNYISGEVEKAAVNLVDFAKTVTLEPGQSQSVVLSCTAYDLASYDFKDKNGNGKATYEIDAGAFTLSLRTDAHTLAEVDGGAELTFNAGEIVFDADPVTGKEIKNRFTGSDAYTGVPTDGSTVNVNATYLSRANFAGTFPTRHSASPSGNVGNGYTNTSFDVSAMPTMGVDSGLRIVTLEDGSYASADQLSGRDASVKLVFNDELVKELAEDYNSEKWTLLVQQMTATELKNLVELGGFRTQAVASVGKPLNTDYDGPAGFNTNTLTGSWGGKSPDTTQWTAFPSEDLLGCSWDKNLLMQMGLSMGAEAAETNCNGWYAPGVNLHRSAYTARNFEYYGEDGVISGKLAAQVIYGAKLNGLYCYLKHFVCSEEGPNPSNVSTWLTEQNLRENYLKPFEIAVKEGGSNAIMSAFNRVGGIWAGANYGLIEGVLRGEWGFKGTVITDWTQGGGSGSYGNVVQGVRAGNDLWLDPNSSAPNGAISTSNPTDMACAQNAAHHILYTYVETYYTASLKYTEAERAALIGDAFNAEITIGVQAETSLWYVYLPLIILDVVVVAALGVWTFFVFKPSKKKDNA